MNKIYMKETVTVGLERYQQLLECEKSIRNEFVVCVRLPGWNSGVYFFRKRDDIERMAKELKELSEDNSYRQELLSKLSKSNEELERIKSHWLVRLLKIK